MADREVTIRVSTDGSGEGIVHAGELLRGYIEMIDIQYEGSMQATTDVVIKERTNPLRTNRTFLTRTDTATGGQFYPGHAVHGATGTAITDAYGRYFLHARELTVEVTGGEADVTDAVVVTIQIAEY